MKKQIRHELWRAKAFDHESVAECLGYFLTKNQTGEYGLHLCFGHKGKGGGFEALLISHRENAPRHSESITDRLTVETRKNVGAYATVQTLTFDTLPLGGEEQLELVVRPYLAGKDGVRRYGDAVLLGYAGKMGADGEPLFEIKEGVSLRAGASDDTYVFNKEEYNHSDFGGEARLPVRNTGEEDSELFRAAYFKFTLDAQAVRALDKAATAKLCVYTGGTESHAERRKYDMMVHATATGWSEHGLNYANCKELAAVGEKLYQGAFSGGRYLAVDILSYLKAQAPNADGTLTVSFRLTNEGHEDALMSNWYPKESDKPPYIEIRDSLYTLFADPEPYENVGYEPWGYAESLVNEWFEDLRDKIYPRDADGNLLYYDEFGMLAPEGYGTTEPKGDFTRELRWKNGTVWTSDPETDFRVTEDAWEKGKYARTLETLGTGVDKAFLSSEYAARLSEYDVYGGITNAGFKGEATGFFHTERHGKRAYIIDPLGNPFFAFGVNTVCLGDDQNHKDYSLKKYGSRKNYYKEISASLKQRGVNNTWVSPDTDELLKVKNGLAVAVTAVGVGRYMGKLGRSQVWEGVYPLNNTINVFDPDFVRHAYTENRKKIRKGGYAKMSRVFGYVSDNELPSGYTILERYLTLDPKEPTAAFSYATAWTWLSRRMGIAAPTLEDYRGHPDYAAINSEFLSFIYARYYGTVRAAIRAVDQNHMYMGARGCYTCLTDEGHHRAAGYYLDIVTANLYGGLNPDAKTVSNFYRFSGKPFMVTEFFAKGMDAIDASGYKLANSTGAGILVHSQEDRAAYFEHYALTMLQAGPCVGLVWYRFRDNDQSLYRAVGGGDPLYMLHVIYGKGAHANTYTDGKGKVFLASELGELEEIYHGEPMASNQNVNKGIYNSDLSSTVTVYTYKDGELIDSMGYEVETPESAYPSEGTVLKAAAGRKTFTVGKIQNADGTVTHTVLTAYEGRYIAFSDAIKSVSDHVMGIIEYFDK